MPASSATQTLFRPLQISYRAHTLYILSGSEYCTLHLTSSLKNAPLGSTTLLQALGTDPALQYVDD